MGEGRESNMLKIIEKYNLDVPHRVKELLIVLANSDDLVAADDDLLDEFRDAILLVISTMKSNRIINFFSQVQHTKNDYPDEESYDFSLTTSHYITGMSQDNDTGDVIFDSKEVLRDWVNIIYVKESHFKQRLFSFVESLPDDAQDIYLTISYFIEQNTSTVEYHEIWFEIEYWSDTMGWASDTFVYNGSMDDMANIICMLYPQNEKEILLQYMYSNELKVGFEQYVAIDDDLFTSLRSSGFDKLIPILEAYKEADDGEKEHILRDINKNKERRDFLRDKILQWDVHRLERILNSDSKIFEVFIGDELNPSGINYSTYKNERFSRIVEIIDELCNVSIYEDISGRLDESSWLSIYISVEDGTYTLHVSVTGNEIFVYEIELTSIKLLELLQEVSYPQYPIEECIWGASSQSYDTGDDYYEDNRY